MSSTVNNHKKSNLSLKMSEYTKILYILKSIKEGSIVPTDIKIQNSISTDLRFLVTCCQVNLSNEDIEFISAHISDLDKEFSSIIKIANQHGILPLVYKTIKSLNINNSLFEKFISDLKPIYTQIAKRNILMSVELINLVKLFKANHIDLLPFKGPMLSQVAYGDITLRQFSDLDILIKKKDIYKINTILIEQNYKKYLLLTPSQERLWIKNTHDIGYIHSQKFIHLELHWSFLDEDYPLQIELEKFWKQTETIQLNGHSISTFSNTYLLLYLCIHGSKHLWERIEWVKDLDLLIKKQKIDWEIFMEEAKNSEFEQMILLGLSLTLILFNTTLPQNITQKISKTNTLNDILNHIFKSWQTQQSTFNNTLVMLKLFPSIKNKINYLQKILFKPTLNEYQFIDLPEKYYWLYYLIRPYLLLKKYLKI